MNVDKSESKKEIYCSKEKVCINKEKTTFTSFFHTFAEKGLTSVKRVGILAKRLGEKYKK